MNDKIIRKARMGGGAFGRRRGAFTLAEMMIAVAILSLLAVLLTPSLSKAWQASLRAEALSNMRQIGTAISLYAADNDNLMPGPLWGGQSPWYNLHSKGTIGYHLWPYIGGPTPQEAMQESPVLSSKGFRAARPTPTSMSLFLNKLVSINGVNCDPWGYQTDFTAAPISSPMKINAIADAGLQKTWAIKDVDQTLPEVATAGWRSSLPAQPVYRPYRLYLYFDWHVEAVKIP